MKKSVILLICWLLISGGFAYNIFSSTESSTFQDESLFPENQLSSEMISFRSSGHGREYDHSHDHHYYHHNPRSMAAACASIFVRNEGIGR